MQFRHIHPAIQRQKRVGHQPGIGAKEPLIIRRKQRRHIAPHIQPDPAAQRRFRQPECARQPVLFVGGDGDRRFVVIQRRAAFDGQPDRWSPGQIKQPCRDPVRPFFDLQRQAKDPCCIDVAADQAEITRLAVQPLRQHVGIAFTIGQLRAAGQAQGDRFTQKRITQFEPPDVQLVDRHAHGKFRQGKRLRLGRGGAATADFGDGRAADGDGFRAQFLHVDLAAQQGGPAPCQDDIIKRQPDAFRIGDGQPCDGCLGT